MSPARRTAYTVVRRVFEQGAYADRALHGEARGLAPQDRALAKQLAFGTIQRKGTLDWVVERCIKPTRPLEPSVRAALWLGLYQLLFLEVAPHAAVSEAVELAKPSPGHKVVNAVLRRVMREGVQLPADDTPEGAAVRHSHPEWMVRTWWEMLGADETRALLEADNRPAELAVRVNTLVTASLDLGRADPELPEARIVDGPFDAFGSPLWAQGAFMPQSRASMHVARAVDPQPGERVLDLCAAPGGKTTHLAALMRNQGEIVAVERHEGRAKALEETCRRMRADIVRVRVADARDPLDGSFDRVLVDPPCSGLGTLQSHPDLRWRATPEGIAEMATLQDELVAAGRRALRPDGTLVYSVCTISAAEERLRGTWRRRLLPHRDGTDGFYIARDAA